MAGAWNLDPILESPQGELDGFGIARNGLYD
jgi:hypothetical protein